MEPGRKSLLSAACVLLLLLMVTTELGPQVAEARTCESQSHRFKGPCLSETNCGSVCRNEGFQRGDCRGFRRRCFCVRDC